MKQISFAVLLTLTVVGLTDGLSLAQFAVEAADLSTAGKSLVMAQSTTPKQAATNEKNPSNQNAKPQPDPIQTPTSDRIDNYQCLEYCAVVRQSCEGTATIQPNAKIATIGSKENTKWSRECQNIYTDCMDKCGIDDNMVQWKRAKIAKDKNKRK